MILYIAFCTLLLALLAVILSPMLKASDVPEKQRTRFAIAVSVFFIPAAFGLYFLWGSPGILPLLEERDQKLTGWKEIIAQRSEDVKINPKNLDAWIELGEGFMETGHFAAAADAFKQAVVLSQGDGLLIIAYAEALIFASNGQVTDEAKKSLEVALMQQPDNPQALYYLAVRELQDGHAKEGTADMKKLYDSLPEGSPVRETIDRETWKQSPWP